MSDDVNKIEISDKDEVGEKQEGLDQPRPDENKDVGMVADGGEGDGFDSQAFEATKGLIQNLSVNIDELTIQQRELRERLKNILENDAGLSELEAVAKEARDAVKKRKTELMNSVEAKEVKAKEAETKEEIKEMKESLTHHLLNYFTITGTQSFETPSGEEREFSFSAKVKKAK